MTDVTTLSPRLDRPEDPLVAASSDHRRRRSGPARTDLLVSRVVAGAAAIGGALAGGAPTSNRAADLVLRAGVAAVVTLAASRARRWTGLLLAGAAAVLSAGLVMRVVANASLLIAVGGTFRRRRSRPWGAVAGALAVQVLLRLPSGGWANPFHGFTALAAAGAIVPVLVSAHRVAGRRQRTLERRVVAVAGALVAASALAFGAAVLSSRARATSGLDDLRRGLGELAVSDPHAAPDLAAAATALESTHTRVDGWWSRPARLVPVLAEQVDALTTLTGEGSALARAASDTAVAADLAGLRAAGGKIDLRKVAGLEAPLRRLEAALVAAGPRVRDSDSPWLLPPLATRHAGVLRQIERARSAARTAGEAAHVLPGLLGANGPRRYFIAFVTPAESRGLGGYMGNYGELTADAGALSLSRSGRTLDLMEHRQQPPDLAGAPADYVARYGRFRPEQFLGDLAYSPDFPTDATVLEQQYQRSTGVAVDGAVSIDPFALAALLQVTGPIQVPGLAEELTATNAAQFLLFDQYVRYTDGAQRVALLQRITDVLFSHLTTSQLPPIGTVIGVLGPVVQEGRLAVHSTDADAQALLRRAGLDGSLPPAGTGDFLSVVTQNSANNKIDVFLQRDIDYRATVDPVSGRVRASVDITLTNKAPASGLPDYVIGGTDPDLPHGTNRVYVSVYTPHRLAGAELDGHAVPMESQQELGRRVHATFVTLGPGSTARLHLTLEGQVAPGRRYRLSYASQPLVNPDHVVLRVAPAAGWRVASGGVFVASGKSSVARPAPDRDSVLRATFRQD